MMTKMIKSVSYSYPSSTNATQLGRGKTGCWSISVAKGASRVPELFDGPFDTQRDAHEAAEKLPYEWCGFQTFPMAEDTHIRVQTDRGVMNYYPQTGRAALDLLRRANNTEGCEVLSR